MTSTGHETMGPYRIVQRLGTGTSTESLLAIAAGPEGFERRVIIKRVLPALEGDPSQRALLAVEASACAHLTHPAILRLYDFFHHEERFALVFEHVDGPPLAWLTKLLRQQGQRLPEPVALFLASRVFAALATAHSARHASSGEFAPVVHRNIHPGTVLVPWDGYAKLTDFGLAKITGVSAETQPGLLKGTYGAMAPEQVLGERVTPRTDVYLGCLLLRELLLGEPAFPEGTPELEILSQMASPSFRPLDGLKSDLHPAVADALSRGLMADPELRSLSAAEMVHVLRTASSPDRGHALLVAELARVRVRYRSEQEGLRAIPKVPRFFVPAAKALALVPPPEPSEPTLRVPRALMIPDPLAAFGPRRDPVSTPSVVPALAPPPVMAPPPPPARLPISDPPGPMLLPPYAAATKSHRLVMLASGVVLAACALAAYRAQQDQARPLEMMETSRAAAAPTPVVSVSAAPIASAAIALHAAPESGTLHTPMRAHDHRVFVNGKVGALHSGVAIILPCGRHQVQLGSHGRVRPVDVPCGGDVYVDTNARVVSSPTP